MVKTIKHEFFFAHPIDIVWQYLTQPELMEQWLMKNDFKPIVGFDFQFRTNPIPSLNFDGIFYCKVLEIASPQKLSYSWNCGPGNGEINLESIVTWKLHTAPKGTLVILEHTGFDKPENMEFFNGFSHGWTEKFATIEKLLNVAHHDNTHA